MTQLGERRTFRWVGVAILLASVGMSMSASEFNLSKLFGKDAAKTAGDFFAEWWPPRLDAEFVKPLLEGAAQTLGIALQGIALAVLIGFPLGLLCSRTFMFGSLFASGDTARRTIDRVFYGVGRACSAFFRSVPEVIWALVIVRVIGLGTGPAILAIGIAYGGMLAKVYSEQIETILPQPATAIESVGAGRVAVMGWGVLPQVFPAMASYTIYRFECAVRASALMGFVGAGGLGFRLQISLTDGLYHEVLTESIILIAIVGAIEWMADRLERRLA